MNIDEYRAMKAEWEKMQSEGSNQDNTPTPTESTPPTETTPTVNEPQPQPTTDSTSTDNTQTPTEPQKIVVNGKEYTPEQIAELERGYLRQADYTRKTQELASQRRQIEQALQVYQAVAQNPELQQQLVQMVPTLDPQIARAQEFEHKYYDAVVENEVLRLSQKYPDFDAVEAMKLAVERKLPNLEDAYLLSKVLNQSTAQQSTPQPQQTQTQQSM